MNIQQRNRLAMYLAVKAVCDVNRSVWQKSPAFTAAYLNFITHLANIQRPLQVKTKETGGARDKTEVQQTMCQAAITIALAIRAHAKKTKNTVMADAINFSVDSLMRESDADCARHCQNFYDLAAADLASLAVHGITVAKLDMLQTAIADFRAIVEKPEPPIPVKGAPGGLSEEFEAADKILGEGLDDLIEQFQFINAKFITDYRNVRTIADAAVSHSLRKDDERPFGQAASV